ncbi:hypothetical protein NliqN6_4221 [Naganishia liquefaciens]|uniref:Uncharacterized protein n=1 Tax=Naganishia liquefaciens TaxID=104408 RepID=A0A8H3YFN4_9TREE|nr:hypothetical protein NliqN6_4221 [Naganishia liquefaciens]
MNVAADAKVSYKEFEAHATARGYQNDVDYNPTCGYVQLTNVPKHLGSVIWSTGWQLFIIIAALLIIFADLALAIPGNTNLPWNVVKFFWLDGMTYDQEIADRDPRLDPREGRNSAKPMPFFLGALGFFKVFVTFGYLSQSFYGIDTGMDEWGESHGPNTQLFCLWAGFILAGSALLGLITGCFLFLAKSPREVSDERDYRWRRNPYRGQAPYPFNNTSARWY